MYLADEGTQFCWRHVIVLAQEDGDGEDDVAEDAAQVICTLYRDYNIHQSLTLSQAM